MRITESTNLLPPKDEPDSQDNGDGHDLEHALLIAQDPFRWSPGTDWRSGGEDEIRSGLVRGGSLCGVSRDGDSEESRKDQGEEGQSDSITRGGRVGGSRCRLHGAFL
jgi:hypothetical protein